MLIFCSEILIMFRRNPKIRKSKHKSSNMKVREEKRQRDRETERQRDRETERKREIEWK